MTENLAGRGEGLVGLRERIVAAIKRAWPKTKVSSYNGVILELEKLCREIALEAAAPAGTDGICPICYHSNAALATPSPQAPPEQCNAFSTTSAREQSSATAASDIAVSVGLAIYARMVRLSHDSNQTVGEKRDYYVTLRQLEEAFIQMRDEVRR